MQAGTIINNRYRIIRPLGGGGMANVYLAHDQLIDRDVTFKIMRMDMRDRTDFVERFRREAQAAAALANEHIVRIYDTGEFDGSHFIVMEYVDGMDLKEFISKNFPIPYQEIVDIMMQILEAVDAAHKAGIIHRDLKPQNVLIGRDNQVKITDFGIAVAKENQDLTQTNSVIGSVHYISPEQIAGSVASVKSDIYALGVILYQLLTNQVPYEGDTVATVAFKHATGEMPSVREFDPKIPQPLENVILRATAKDPVNRYDSVQEMANDLKTSLSPRRAKEAPYVPLAEDATRVIPMGDLEDRMKQSDEEPSESNDQATNQEIENQILDYAAEGLGVKKIAQLVGQTPKYVRHILEENGVRQHNHKLRIVGLVGLVLVIVGLFTFAAVESNYTKVPDVSNLTQRQATSKLESAHFSVDSQISYTSSKSVNKDRVVKTAPTVGTRLKKGTKVRLVLSSGGQKVQFGDYRDTEYEATAAKLTAQGFTVKKVERSSNDIAAGKIISQSVKAGDLVDPNETTVTFTVSTGVSQVTVPDFTGKTVNDVESWSNSNGIAVSYIHQESSAARNQVLGQSVSAGAKIATNQTLQITISDGQSSSQSAPDTPPSSSKSSSQAQSQSQSQSQNRSSTYIFFR